MTDHRKFSSSKFAHAGDDREAFTIRWITTLCTQKSPRFRARVGNLTRQDAGYLARGWNGDLVRALGGSLARERIRCLISSAGSTAEGSLDRSQANRETMRCWDLRIPVLIEYAINRRSLARADETDVPHCSRDGPLCVGMSP